MTSGGAHAGSDAHAHAVVHGQSRPTRIYSFILVTSLFFTWGFAYGLVNVLNKHFQDIFGISKTQTTLMQVAYFGAYFVCAIPAGQFSHRFGYKMLIYVGLGLYSLGAFMFWPSAVTEKYYGFVLSTIVIGAGLVSLEVAANSYISILGSPEHAAMRLTLAQGFQSVASFTGPLIASHAFVKDANVRSSLHTVQWVYLGVGLLGVCLNILFFFCKLPEISETQLQEELDQVGTNVKPLWKQYHTLLGALAEFCYVGAQVSVASFVVFYITEDPSLSHRFSDSAASDMFSYCQIAFMVGRFIGTPFLNYFPPDIMLLVWSTVTTIFSLVAALTGGSVGLAALFLVFFFQSIQFPVIFCLGTENLGKWTKRGSSLLVMGVGGGAVFPPIQGAVADHLTSVRSYVISFAACVAVTAYAAGMVIDRVRRSKAILLEDTETPSLQIERDSDSEREKKQTVTQEN